MAKSNPDHVGEVIVPERSVATVCTRRRIDVVRGHSRGLVNVLCMCQ